MSTTYRVVSWNPQKYRYDSIAAGAILSFILVVLGLQAWLRAPALTIETLLIRALGTAAFLLLHVILCIGPLCRLDRAVPAAALQPPAPRRDDVPAGAGARGLRDRPVPRARRREPARQPADGEHAATTSVRQFPFQPFGLAALLILFLMAATSHDFWLTT